VKEGMSVDHNQFSAQVFDLAKKAGFSEWELYYEDKESLKLQAFQGEIIEYASSNTKGANFRGIFNGQLGSSFSEILDSESAEMIVQKAKASAQLTEVEDLVFIYGEKQEYPQIELVHPALVEANIERKINLVLNNEKQAMGTGKIDKIFGTYYIDGYVRKRALNSHGLDLTYAHNHALMYMEVIASLAGTTYSATDYEINQDFAALEQTPLGLRSAEKVDARKGASPVKSGQYPVILENSAAASLLAAHMSVFSAEAAQKGMSLLKDKEGAMIAAEKITLVDDPLLAGGMASAPFDGEGVPCRRKNLIENGQLATLLHNLKTARKANRETTGNASRGGFKGTIGVSHSNAYIQKGTITAAEMIKKMSDGLVITELDGLHAGTNAITGDFSLGARGFLVRGGVIERPVNQIVLSGNFFTLLKEVAELADDLRFYFEPVGSPSLLIPSLSVAGE
jgi:PmbA protein